MSGRKKRASKVQDKINTLRREHIEMRENFLADLRLFGSGLPEPVRNFTFDGAHTVELAYPEQAILIDIVMPHQKLPIAAFNSAQGLGYAYIVITPNLILSGDAELILKSVFARRQLVNRLIGGMSNQEIKEKINHVISKRN